MFGVIEQTSESARSRLLPGIHAEFKFQAYVKSHCSDRERPRVFDFQSCREFLRAELAFRIGKNPRYSLRAFAAKLKIAPSFLSEVFSGSAHLSLRNLYKIAEQIELNEEETEYLSLLGQLESADSTRIKRALLKRLHDINPGNAKKTLPVEKFGQVADWHHFAVLHLTEVLGEDFTQKNAAARLGIGEREVNEAIERWMSLGILVRLPGGGFAKDASAWEVSSEAPEPTLRRFHRQTLEKAIESLEVQGSHEKFVGSETFAFDRRRLPEAKKVINSFMDNMVRQYAPPEGQKTDVYHLGVQFFNLTWRVGEKVGSER